MAEQQQTTTPELTVEERIAALEQRAEAFPPELRQQWREILELTRNYERCRAIERATKVTLPPDTSRWRGTSAPPAPAEPTLGRPGFVDDAPLGPPPGIRWVDALCDAQDARDRAALVEADRQHRQAILDAFAEGKLIDEQRTRAAAERRSFHKSPQDPDFDLR